MVAGADQEQTDHLEGTGRSRVSAWSKTHSKQASPVLQCDPGRQCPALLSLVLGKIIPYSKAKFACCPRCFLTSYFCIPVPYNEKDIFFGY